MLKVTAQKLEMALFTTSKPEEKSHRCVMVFDSKHAITYQHGTAHSLLKKGEKLMLYNVVNPDLEIEVVVNVVPEKNDFIIFESVDGDFPHYPSGFDDMYRSQKYLQLGVGQKREPVWKEGIISKKCAGYFLGTLHGEHGDSGSGIFDLNGRFIGISVAKKRFALTTLQISGPTIDFGQVADHHPETQIISADVAYAFLGTNDPDYEPPEKKHAPETE